MKKDKRIISLCLILMLICLSLTGCKKKIITYPADAYRDIYSEIEIIDDDNLIDIEDIYPPDTNIPSYSDDDDDNNTYTSSDEIDDTDDEEDNDLGIDMPGGRVYNVSAFGAKGDGKTDDSPAINEAIRVAKIYTKRHSDKKAEIRFEKNKTYAIKSRGNQTSPGHGLISLYEARNITLAGDNTTLEGLPTNPYLYIEYSSNVHIKGFNFNYDTPVACTAKVVEKAEGGVVFEVPEWYAECARKSPVFPESQAPFAIEANGLRHHRYVSKATVIDKTHVMLDASFDIGAMVYIPTPGYAHCGNIAFQVLHNPGTVTFENMNIWNASQFVFQLNSNTGDVNYINVRLAPKDSSSSATVAWRDVIHSKDNRQPLSFDRCVFKGTHDDIFNLSNTMCQIVDVGDDNEIRIVGLDYANGEYATLQEGDTAEVIDPYTGKFYGTAKVAEIIVQTASNIRIRLDRNLNLEGGEYIYFNDLANPGTKAVNCEFDGTYRIKGMSTFENCKFNTLVMWIAYSGMNSQVEGPIPHDITFNNCTFTADMYTDNNVFSFNCETIGGDKDVEYHIRNIVFNKCSFAYPGMIDKNFPYITIK